MEPQSRHALSLHQSRPGVPCAQCGETLFAAEWAERPDDRRIRYLWSCDACGYDFESEAHYPDAVLRRKSDIDLVRLGPWV
jgi:ribosomal protein L37AE/L43A